MIALNGLCEMIRSVQYEYVMAFNFIVGEKFVIIRIPLR